MFKGWLMTNFPCSAPKSKLGKKQDCVAKSEYNKQPNHPEVDEDKGNRGFSSFQLTSWRREQQRKRFFRVSLLLTFSLLGAALSAISKSTSAANLWELGGGEERRQMERGVGTRAGRAGGFVRTFSCKQNFFKNLFNKLVFFKQEPFVQEDFQNLLLPQSKTLFFKTLFFKKLFSSSNKSLSRRKICQNLLLPRQPRASKTYLFFCFSQFSALKIR